MTQKKQQQADTMTMEEAVAADAVRQAEEAAQQREAADDAAFRVHLARMGGVHLQAEMARAILEILSQIQTRLGDKPWKKRSQEEQRDAINRAEFAAREMLIATVNAVAANTMASISARIETIAIKDGFKITVRAPGGHDHRHALFDSVGKNVVEVLADPDVFAQHKPIRTKEPEPDLLGHAAEEGEGEAEPETDGAEEAEEEAEDAPVAASATAAGASVRSQGRRGALKH